MKKTTFTTALTVLAMTGVLPLYAFAEDHGGEGKGKQHHEKMEQKWKEKDTNGDGAIDKSEFLNGAEERFKKMDTDGDGKITKEEMKKAHEARREKWKERKGKMGEGKPGGEHGEEGL